MNVTNVILAAGDFTGVAAIVTAVVALLGSLGTIYVAKRKADVDTTVQAFDQQNKTISDLRSDNSHLRSELDTIRADYVQLRSENSMMRLQIENIREDVKKCHEERDRLRAQLER